MGLPLQVLNCELLQDVRKRARTPVGGERSAESTHSCQGSEVSWSHLNQRGIGTWRLQGGQAPWKGCVSVKGHQDVKVSLPCGDTLVPSQQSHCVTWAQCLGSTEPSRRQRKATGLQREMGLLVGAPPLHGCSQEICKEVHSRG